MTKDHSRQKNCSVLCAHAVTSTSCRLSAGLSLHLSVGPAYPAGTGHGPASAHFPHPLQVQPQAAANDTDSLAPKRAPPSAPKMRKSVSSRVHEAVKAIALCHNVTPVYEARVRVAGETESPEADQDLSIENCIYQASSPDEVSGRWATQQGAWVIPPCAGPVQAVPVPTEARQECKSLLCPVSGLRGLCYANTFICG